MSSARRILDQVVASTPEAVTGGEPWLAPGSWPVPQFTVQYGNRHLRLFYEDGENVVVDRQGLVVEDAELDAAVDLFAGVDTFYGEGGFDGDLKAMAVSEDDVQYAFVVPPGSEVPHLFTKRPGEMWASAASSSFAQLMMSEGVATLSWTPDGGAFRVEQFGE